ncbi:hypothetical protein Poli38472_005663 [Pythium oligandrum]|uniref:Aspergillus nuclease S(1) n=1 Tax=Pythium oligandrum TaxID=41045 RepID=A0A8K1FGR0_PYTOL|nr:hypothetical protein Poli38472_005663 [Pythium oligandrum]|eukprot:TMW63045.1 hypothetical protein Poli38472_005663 [Pythium oligandrum]
MKTWTVATTVAVLGAAAMTPVQGWWDNGHMLVGEVASQLLAPKDRATIEKVLSDWERSFPNTNTVATAAIWPDLVKCSKSSTSCSTAALPSFSSMDKWHYINLPLNANGTQWGSSPPDLNLFKASFGGEASTVLEQFLATFNTTQSLWSANLALRQLIHIVGDMHQPMHAVTAVSEKLPGGDSGGNSYKFQSPCAFSNLHALYDAAGGAYTNNWALKMDSSFKAALKKNASELAVTIPKLDDKVKIEQYANLSYPAFSKALIDNSAFKKFFLESYELSTSFAYPKLDLTFNDAGNVPCPSEEYIKQAVLESKTRIALAGKRLSIILSEIAPQLRALKLA